MTLVALHTTDPPNQDSRANWYWLNITNSKIWKVNPATRRYVEVSSDLSSKALLGTAALVNTGNSSGQIPTVPVPMASISTPVKSTIDGITNLIDSAAFHNASEFTSDAEFNSLSAAQSSTASSLSTLSSTVNGKASIAYVTHQAVNNTDWLKFYIPQTVTTDATVTTVYTSAVIPENSVIFVDALFLSKQGGVLGSTCLSMQCALERTTGGSLVKTQAERLQTTGSLGLTIATCGVTAVSNILRVNVIGRLLTTLTWNGWVAITQNA